MVQEAFGVAIIGGGPAGYSAAIRAAQLGLKVALIEKRDTLGGTCLNVGCIPSKALLETTELFHTIADKLGPHGIKAGKPEIDVGMMMRRKDKVVKELTDGLTLLMRKNKITVFNGRGRFLGPNAVEVRGVDGQAAGVGLTAQSIVIATGSEPIELPFLKFDGEQVVSSTEALCLGAVPKHLVVVGAGAVGLELGSVWNRLGAKVTVVELLDRLVPAADKEMSTALERALRQQGIEFKFRHQVTGGKKDKKGFTLTIKDPEGQESALPCDKALIAVGRRAYTDDLGLETAGVAAPVRGKITIDKYWRTNVPHIYAIGDIVTGPMLAHKAEEEGVAVAEVIAGKPGHVNYAAIPNIVYTWPELAQVGESEEELKARGAAYSIGRYSFRANGRAKTMAETDGVCKVLADAKSGRILGVHIVGPRASDMIAEAVTAMEFRASAEDLYRTSHAHPTLSEILKEAAMGVDKRTMMG